MIIDRLTESIDQLPNKFSKLDWACWNDWLKIIYKFLLVGDEKGILGNRRHHSASKEWPNENYNAFRD